MIITTDLYNIELCTTYEELTLYIESDIGAYISNGYSIEKGYHFFCFLTKKRYGILFQILSILIKIEKGI